MKKLYLFSGDPFLVQEKTQEVIALSAKEVGEPPTEQVYYLKDTSLEHIFGEARTLPFMTRFQILIIRECERLKKEDIEALSQYLMNAPETAALIFESESVSEKSPLFELIKTHGQALVIDKEKGRLTAQRFLTEKLKQFGKTMPDTVQKRLKDEVGNSPAFLDSILNQLILYSGEKTEITHEMLDLFEEKWSGADAFQLIEAIFSGDASTSMQHFQELTQSGDEDLTALTGLIHWQLKRLWQASVMLEEGQSEGTVQKKCRVFPKQARSFMMAVRRMKREALESAIEKLFRLDWAIKTGESKDLMGLERWILETTTNKK